MALIVSWAYTVSGVREALYAEDQFLVWLRRLVLEEPEPSVRREVCMALYRSVVELLLLLVIGQIYNFINSDAVRILVKSIPNSSQVECKALKVYQAEPIDKLVNIFIGLHAFKGLGWNKNVYLKKWLKIFVFKITYNCCIYKVCSTSFYLVGTVIKCKQKQQAQSNYRVGCTGLK